jgi:hypothetical protein
MTVRDELGAVEVGIGDRFQVQGAGFSVICPEFNGAKTSVWVRLESGGLTLTDGRRIEFRPESHGGFQFEQVFLFTGELAARVIREHRLMTFDLPAPARVEKKTPRAHSSKQSARKHGPMSQALFD